MLVLSYDYTINQNTAYLISKNNDLQHKILDNTTYVLSKTLLFSISSPYKPSSFNCFSNKNKVNSLLSPVGGTGTANNKFRG